MAERTSKAGASLRAGRTPLPSVLPSSLGRPLAKKSWGQHYLRDRAALAAIVQQGGDLAGKTVVELGAGAGALTAALLAAGAQVIAIERDRDLLPHLADLAERYSGMLNVVAADAQRIQYSELVPTRGAAVHVFGNLPYQLSSRLLVQMADQAAAIARATVLVQKEVGERLMAQPGGRTFGLLSVLVQRQFVATAVRAVPPGAFRPPPKVDSLIVHLERRSARPYLAATGVDEATQEGWLVRAARAAFAARRKTLRNSLRVGLQGQATDIESALAAAAIDPTARAETLTLQEFASLGRALFAHSEARP